MNCMTPVCRYAIISVGMGVGYQMYMKTLLDNSTGGGGSGDSGSPSPSPSHSGGHHHHEHHHHVIIPAAAMVATETGGAIPAGA